MPYSLPIADVRSDFAEPVVYRDLIIETHEPADCGLSLMYVHDPGSVVYLAGKLDAVAVRGPFATGMRLRHAWNTTIVDPFINGVLDQQTHEQLQAATMRRGIDCGGSMDVHIARPRITCARTGIYVEDTHLGGQGEGFHCDGGWVMHAVTGIELNGFGSGGWWTPNAWISRMHFCVTGLGVRGHRWSGVHIRDNDFYGSQLDSYPWGIYLTECSDVIIQANRFWHNRPQKFMGAIVLDNCHRVQIQGNLLSPGITIALHATASCTGITHDLDARRDVVVDASR